MLKQKLNQITTMTDFKLPSDRTIDSTDNNEFATGLNDETLLAENLVDIDPLDDMIPDAVNEAGEGDRPLYNESGIRDTGL